MKTTLVLLKLLTATIVFMVVATIFMATTASYLPRLSGANYYDSGCYDGVTYTMVSNKELNEKTVAHARVLCKLTADKLRKQGYLF